MATIVEVELSDGGVCSVRQLRLFELDEVKVKLIGPYIYELETIDGRKYLAEYDGSRWSETGRTLPPKPDRPESEVEVGSTDWYDLVENLRYEAWLLHEKERNKLMREYHMDVARHILNECVSENDQRRIVNPDDWAKVHKAALVPELTLEVLAETLQATFQGDL